RAVREGRAAVVQRVEPVRHVAFQKLLRGMEQNLFAGESGTRPDDVTRITELVAESECAARLIKTPARPDALGNGLIFQPILDLIKLRLGRFHAQGLQKSQR